MLSSKFSVITLLVAVLQSLISTSLTLDIQEHQHEHPLVHDNTSDCEHIDEEQGQV